jgi:ATP-dependent RNA helicase DHX57
VNRVRSGADVDYCDFHDQNSKDARLVKAAVCAGFYPQILRVENPLPKFKQTAFGAVESDTDGIAKLFDRVKGRVFVHPSSVNRSAGKFETGWMVHTEMVETSKIFIRQCSMVPVYAVLLFGGQLQVNHELGEITVDGWARLRAPPKVGVLVRELRKLLDDLLAAKLEDPCKHFSEHPVVKAMLELLRNDGM